MMYILNSANFESLKHTFEEQHVCEFSHANVNNYANNKNDNLGLIF